MYWIFFFFFGKDAFLALDSFSSFLNLNRGQEISIQMFRFEISLKLQYPGWRFFHDGATELFVHRMNKFNFSPALRFAIVLF